MGKTGDNGTWLVFMHTLAYFISGAFERTDFRMQCPSCPDGKPERIGTASPLIENYIYIDIAGDGTTTVHLSGRQVPLTALCFEKPAAINLRISDRFSRAVCKRPEDKNDRKLLQSCIKQFMVLFCYLLSHGAMMSSVKHCVFASHRI